MSRKAVGGTRATLRLLVDEKRPQEVPIDARPVTFGRDAAADIIIDSPYAGRFHARIQPVPDGHEIVDLDSRNGTFVNGSRIASQRRLRNGDLIQIATLQMTYARATRDDTTAIMPANTADPARSSDSLTIDPEAREARFNDTAIDLSRFEFELLALLDARRGKVRTSAEIGDAIWGQNRWDLNMLYALMRRLRRKLQGAGADAAVSIVNVEGIGYKLGRADKGRR